MSKQTRTNKADNGDLNLIDILAKGSAHIATNEDYEKIGEFYAKQEGRKLYRYRPAIYDTAGRNIDLETIERNQIWFSVPQKFNDPFDCSFAVDVQNLSGSFLSQHPFLNEGRARLKQLPLVQKSKTLKKMQAAVCKAIEESEELANLEKTAQGLSVACLCEHKDSILMWGHYANSHRGICVEYDLAMLRKEKLFFAPVIYSDIFPPMNFISNEQINRSVWGRVLTKANEWSYEAEWRCIRDSASCGSCWLGNGALLPAPPPTAIYIGCNAESRLEADVLRLCDMIGIHAYKMRTSKTKFGLLSE